VRIKVVIHEAEEGGYWAEAPALPGCFSQGESWDEVVENIREAIEGWLLTAADLTSPAPAGKVIEINL
jgi:predicted RNase H-like HicB family nuclease